MAQTDASLVSPWRRWPRLASWLDLIEDVSLNGHNRSRRWRYGLAIVFAALSLTLRLWLHSWFDPSLFVLPLGAVFLAAWYAGYGPGLAVAGLSIASGYYYLSLFVPQIKGRETTIVLNFVSFGVVAILITLIVEARYHAKNRARQADTEANQKIRESEQRFRHLADTAPAMIWMAGPDHLCTYFNKAWLNFTGRPLEKEIGNGWIEVIHPEDLDSCRQIYDQAFDDRRSFTQEYRLRRHDGQYRWVLDSGTPRYDEQGTFLGYIGSCIDIEDRKVAEVRVEASERRFRGLAESIPQIVWTAGPDGLIDYYNNRWYEFSGFEPVDPIPAGLWGQRIHPDDFQPARDLWHQSVSTGADFQAVFRMRDRTGEYLWFLGRAQPMRDRQGKIVKWFGSATNINRQHQLFEALKDQSRRVDKLVSNVPGVVWEAYGQPDAASQRMDFVSNHVETMLGYSVAEWLKTPNFWLTIVHPDDRKQAAAEAMAKFESGLPGTSRFRWRTKAGRYLWVEAHSTAIFDALGKAIGMRGVTMDITRRKYNEDKLRFMSEASQTLNSSLNYQETLKAVTRHAVPALADWCSVDLRASDGQIQTLVVSHSDPAKVTWAKQIQAQFPPDPEAPTGVSKVIRTGQSELYPDIPEEMLAAVAKSPKQLALLKQVGFSSVIIVPLKTTDGVIGAISFVSAESGFHYSKSDLSMAEDLAARAAIAIENARLYESSQRLATIVASSDDAIFSKDLTGVITSWNRGAEKIYGYSPTEAIGQRVTILVPATLPNEVSNILERIKRGEHIEHYRTERITKDRRRIFVSLTVSPIQNSKGKIIGASAIARDITAQVKAEEQVQYQARLIENVSEAIFSTDLDYRILSWNRAAENIYGWAESEVLGRSAAEFMGTLFNDSEKHSFRDRLAADGSWKGELTQRRRDNQEIKLMVSVDAVRDSAGKVVGFVTVNRDITGLKRMEQQLLENEQRFRLIAENSTDLISMTTEDGHYSYVSPSFKTVLGYEPKKLLAMRTDQLLNPDDIKSLGGWQNDRLQEIRVRKANGEWLWIEGTSYRVRWQGGSFLVGIGRDISERKALEQRKDEFISIASHELRSPVTTMKVYTQNLLRSAARRELAESEVKALETIERQTDKLIRLVNSLLDVSRLGVTDLNSQPLNVGELVTEVSSSLKLMAGRRQISLIESSPVKVLADPIRIEQVLTNLLTNAIQHSADGSQIFVRVRRYGGEVRVSVRDQGEGIEKDRQRFLFERFFQVNREHSGGVGLGLYIAGEIINRHGGKIWVDSKPGQGSTFVFSLPLVPEAQTATKPKPVKLQRG